ncbi:MAG: hypothetical protein V4498_02850 [candidate division FCPU426 bacterium]
MICHLGTACSNTATKTLKINDFRTGFVEKSVPACDPCIMDQPALIQEHENWKSKHARA